MDSYKYQVTIGMPVYGVENYIRKCMLSVLNQTFKDNIEIIAIDDRGPDKSIDIIKELRDAWALAMKKARQDGGTKNVQGDSYVG